MLHIKVNATSANLCVGFDTLGIALSLANEFTFERADSFSYIGFLKEYENSDNLVQKSYEYTFLLAKEKVIPVRIGIENNIPISRGLGSSSSLIVAGVMAANHYLNNRFSRDECVDIAAKIEGHPDNVAAAVYGGLVASLKDDKGYLNVLYPVAKNLEFIVISPSQQLETTKAREVLPKSQPYDKIVSNLSRIVHIPKAFGEGDLELLKKIFKDELHEPYRMPLIKNSFKYKALAQEKGYPFCISGSGSSMLIIGKNIKDIEIFKKFNDEVRILKTGGSVEVYESE